ncbi:MAG: cytochrome c nitrite reductase small subunit [Alphaproteobacteria bacterium]|uniref:Cytochrome c nitrite reductase small subunit n=1 Tax=Candidatus Nitrobium versatile TaxID=2884831 RepID=A0A953J3U5_9BACT|nr:cytochrome c nitrite reductase small subunit [Candidatus Nitrobium versatile]
MERIEGGSKKMLSKKVALLLAGLLLAFLPFGIGSAWTHTNKPEFCISCHTMEREYRNWSHSGHRNWAGCGDCHVPQQNVVAKVAGKARDGINHGYAFLSDRIPDPIRISKHAESTVMENCIRCHGEMVAKIKPDQRKCWDCHRNLPHGY